MWWLLLAVTAPAAPSVTRDRVEGPLSRRFPSADGAALSLLVVGEHDGRVGPCGCSTTPRGGLPRLASAVRARREADPTPDLLLHGGGWLSAGSTLAPDGGELLSRDALEADVRMHKALGRLPFDALCASVRDVPAVALGPRPGMVAANLEPGGLPIVPSKRFERGGVEVLVVGLSGPGLAGVQPPEVGWTDPLAALAALPLTDSALVVVLAYGLSSRVAELAAVQGVDVVVDTHGWEGSFEPLVLGDAVVVRTPAAGASLLELRLWVDAGRVTAAHQRTTPLDAAVPEDPFLAGLAAAD